MEETKKEIIYVNIDEILPNRFQPRLAFDDKELNELANSIIKYGVIQPIVVRPLGDKYEIIAGERRFKASTIAGLKKIPAVLMPTDDNTSAEIALLENLQRKNLTPIEEAKAYKKLIDRGFTQEDIATKLGVSQPLVANKIRLLNLPEEVQNALLYNQISERHARSLLVLNNKDLQNNLLKRIISEKLTVKQTEDEISILLGKNNYEVSEKISLDSFLAPSEKKEEVKEELKEKENMPEKEEEKDILDDLEFVDFSVPNVVDIEEEKEVDTQVEYKETPEVVNPFQQEKQEVEETKVMEEFKPNENSNMPKIEEMDMPSSPFNEASEELGKEMTVQEEIPQKSIAEQLGEVTYESKEPTIEDLNISEDFNKIERIDTEQPEIQMSEEEMTIEEELTNEYGEIDLPKVITKVRDFTSHLGTASQSIDVSEVDLPDKYQITIEINKK